MVKSVFGTKSAPYAHKAVKKCRQLGAKIAIATAETCPDFVKPQQKKFLSSLGIKETDQQFCDSCGYNTEKGKGVCLSKGCLWVENPYDFKKLISSLILFLLFGRLYTLLVATALKVTTFPPYLMQTFQNRIKLWVQYPSDEDFLC